MDGRSWGTTKRISLETNAGGVTTADKVEITMDLGEAKRVAREINKLVRALS
jgi:hypothetical protein